ncbi:hypothetical protein ACFQZS_04300 [Mucilaginibacter calamicampi]|uniref:Uncharacterized protein n=1 Tax=Mucilaginibacter calamicampi TaxID=1302352 RepID=A0ABW2YSF0_9SPHI
MKKNHIIFALLYLLVGCKSVPDGFKELDVNKFTIALPEGWNYQNGGEQGGPFGDSFGGFITGPNLVLNFEGSDMGYANNLVVTEQYYLEKGGWREACHFCKPDVTYTDSANVDALKKSEMQMKGIKDSSLVKVEPYPVEKVQRIYKLSPSQKIEFPTADYMIDIVSNGEVKTIPLGIPLLTKRHNFKIDTTDKYIIKTLWPTVPGKGMTGIYIKSRTGKFNFQMNGINLPLADQQAALAGFKTITFKQ